jgi:hypothetical protein
MDQSEKIFKELSELRESLPGIEKAEWEAVTNPELQQSVLTLIVMEKIILEPNDSRMAEARAKIEEVKKRLYERRKIYRTEYGRISKELMALTSPEIRGFVEDFHLCMARAKLKSEILSTNYDGRKQETILTVRSNKVALLQLKRMVTEAVALLETMRLQSVPVIEKEGNRLLDKIEKFDWKCEETQKISETDYYRGGPAPAGVSPASIVYGGPLTELR